MEVIGYLGRFFFFFFFFFFSLYGMKELFYKGFFL